MTAPASLYYKIPQDVAKRTDLTPTAKLVYAFIVDAMRGKGVSWPGVRTIAAAIGGSEKAVRVAVEKLVEGGLITIAPRRRGQRNQYHLPPESAVESTAVNDKESAVKMTGGAVKTTAQVRSKRPHKKNRLKKQTIGAPRKRDAPSESKTKRPKPDPRVSAFVRWWGQTYQQHRHKPWQNTKPGKDSKLVKSALCSLDETRTDRPALDLLQAAALRLFRDPPRWSSAEPSIGLLYASLNELLPQPKAATAEESTGILILLADRFPDDVEQNRQWYKVLDAMVRMGRTTIAEIKDVLQADCDGPTFRRAFKDDVTETDCDRQTTTG